MVAMSTVSQSRKIRRRCRWRVGTMRPSNHEWRTINYGFFLSFLSGLCFSRGKKAGCKEEAGGIGLGLGWIIVYVRPRDRQNKPTLARSALCPGIQGIVAHDGGILLFDEYHFLFFFLFLYMWSVKEERKVAMVHSALGPILSLSITKVYRVLGAFTVYSQTKHLPQGYTRHNEVR